jgi:uncharacterized protein YggE
MSQFLRRTSLRRAALPASAAVLLSAAVVAAVVGSGSSSVAAPGDPAPHTVTVAGTGHVLGTPDVLRLDLGVQRTGDNVNAALNAANGDIRKIKAALSKHGVADKDIQTSQLSINPHYVDNGKTSTVKGYDVFQSLTVKLRKLDDAGSAISDAADAGGNATRINGVSFDIEDNVRLLKQARDAAFADAKTKAEQYARLAGKGLGSVSSVSESTNGGGPVPYPMAMYDSAGSAAKSSVPVEAGSQQVSIDSTVVWELDD